MTCRLLDALQPRGATWSGKVISSPPGPRGGPFMTHLLPGGGVPRVYGARSPVPPRLPSFATLRSVRHLATVVAGAYSLRRPPDAWSPALPAPLGPCYWLVASGTPMGWRGGSLAAGSVRSTVCYYCLGGCSALVVCARRSRQVWGVGAGAGSRSSLPSCPSRCVLRVVLCGCLFLLPAGTPFHAVCAFRGLGLVALLGPRRVSVGCGCARASAVYAPLPPPPRVGVARAPRAVLVQGAGRTVPARLCPSAFPAPVPCSAFLSPGGGGVARSLRPRAWLGVAHPPPGGPALASWLSAL